MSQPLVILSGPYLGLTVQHVVAVDPEYILRCIHSAHVVDGLKSVLSTLPSLAPTRSSPPSSTQGSLLDCPPPTAMQKLVDVSAGDQARQAVRSVNPTDLAFADPCAARQEHQVATGGYIPGHPNSSSLH